MRRLVTVVGLALAMTACSAVQPKDVPAPAVSTEKPAKKIKAGTFSDGTWRVGADIEAGTYRANAKMGCYWERMRGFSGDTLKDIISNGVSASDGPVTVTIKKTDLGFKSQLCGTWTKV
jgi:hypothetical protein